ncbi:MAG: hypothetical protein K2H64_11960, partial [Desulfovibrio sp.]|nr:hypothetical protein [Desulfovibrio sp.]
FSHIECVTVSGPEKGGTSRALADKLLPFGWIVLKRCSFDEYQKSIEAIDAMFLEESEKMAEREAKERKVREEREAREREAAEAARKREEELAKLSPEERELWELVQPDATENMASAIYAKLERYGDLKIKAAEALKAYWIRINKWEGKELTKKQKEKVKVARMILEGRE